jgi:hypothetical protein
MSPIIRADREIAIEDFGRSRVAEAVSRLHRKQGLGMLTSDALDELLSMLEADYALQQRLNADSRALYAEHASSRVEAA